MELLQNNKRLTLVSPIQNLLGVDVWWILSWVVTFLKIPLLAVCLYQLFEHSVGACLTIMLIVLADILDGDLMENSNALMLRSRKIARHIFDVVGDRIVIFSVTTTLLFTHTLDAYIFGMILFREVALSVITTFPLYSKGLVLKSDWASKIATVFIALIAINHILSIIPVIVLLTVFALFAAVGFYNYLFNYEAY